MNYVIIQDSRKNKGRILVLVDRNKSKSTWWTSDLDNALVFTSREQAQKQCEKYKYNYPRVIPFDVAKKQVIPIVTTNHKTTKKNILEMDMWEYNEWLGYSDAIEYGGESF